ETPHDREQIRAGAEPGAAVGKVSCRAFEYRRVPADGSQKVGGEQPPERTANYQGAWPIHIIAPHIALRTMPAAASRPARHKGGSSCRHSVSLDPGGNDNLAPALALLAEERGCLRRRVEDRRGLEALQFGQCVRFSQSRAYGGGQFLGNLRRCLR